MITGATGENVFVWNTDTETMTRVTTPMSGDETDGESYPVAVTAAGVVLFNSTASNLRTDIDGGLWDCLRYDPVDGTITHIFDGACDAASLDGGFVAVRDVSSGASALIDLTLGTAAAFCVNTAGDAADEACAARSVSADGNLVLFVSEATNLGGGGWVFVRDVAGESTRPVTSAGDVTDGLLSADGRYVLFSSAKSDLVADDGNNAEDVFVDAR